MVDHIDTSKQLSALRQVRAAIEHFNKDEFECAMTLAAAGEGQLPEKGADFLLRILRLRAPTEDFNLFINWLKQTERALNAHYGDAIGEIKEIEKAIEAAESSVEAARDEVRLEVGIHDPTKFNELAASVEAKQDAPWLRRRKNSDGAEGIVVVDLDQGVERPATPEEAERGIFYSDFEQYKQGKAA
jgi:hypothetical protein